MTLAVATVACRGSDDAQNLRDQLRHYCAQLPSTYDLRIADARDAKYESLGQFWLFTDGASNLHQKFELCLNVAGFSEAERQEIFDSYFKQTLDGVRNALSPVLADQAARTEANQRKLVEQLEAAHKLAERVAAFADKHLR